MNRLASFVWNFDANAVFAWNRSDDTNARDAHGNGKVVREVDDLLQSQTRLEVDLVLRNDRAAFDFDDLDLVAKLLASLFKDSGTSKRFGSLFFQRNRNATFQHLDRRKVEFAMALCRRGSVELIHYQFAFARRLCRWLRLLSDDFCGQFFWSNSFLSLWQTEVRTRDQSFLGRNVRSRLQGWNGSLQILTDVQLSCRLFDIFEFLFELFVTFFVLPLLFAIFFLFLVLFVFFGQ